ncbi:type II secretion system F family protein [Pontivivens nitratireducens]|uniref:Pilus assembly protein TadB n=1 Tax=Pontivivens nitratireducens TaxID=2758038 RepID=A0A6G7VJ34_9RHOB|nr:type II secretion system F family protein [Pontibrevibacter nitratireducens]QIK40049.1 pilus assembly protein TadB [Pontibrevibacter nitratireducens]
MSFEPIIYAMIFVGVLLMVEGVYLLIFGKSVRLESKVNRRLELLEKGEDPEDVLETLRAERDQHRRNSGIPIMAPLYERAAQANIAFTPRGLVLVIGMMAIMVFVLLTIFSSAALVLRIGISILMGFGGVYLWLNNKAKARMALFEEQLPDAVELIVRSLRVGHPFSSSVSIVAHEMPDPLGTEFGIIADEATYGMDITESLARMAERISVQDLRFLSVAVSIQAQSGGNLAEVLAGLSAVIRSRFKLFRRVKAITAEARWSGWFLSVFPLLAIIIIQLVEPNYYDEVQETSLFTPAVIVVGVFLVVNVLFMRAMVNIKV